MNDDKGMSWREGGECPACRTRVRLAARMPWPGFSHMDFQPKIPGPLNILVCDTCGLGGLDHSSHSSGFEGVFENKTYVDRVLPVHYVQAPDADVPVAAPHHQVDILSQRVGDVRAVLDIGCFDGRFLRAFQACHNDARLVGYDVSPHNSRFFDDGLQYVTGGLENIQGTFDLITMSHSLQYEPDLSYLFTHIKRLLAPQGALFLQVPDVSRKPTGLVLADVHHHFSALSLANVTTAFGFVPEIVSGTGFRRDALIVARRATQAGSPLEGGAACFDESLEMLQALADQVKTLRGLGPWNILGTTIDAAFVFHLLGDRAGGFIDETPGAADTLFQDRCVRHPRSLRSGEKTVMPLGRQAGDVLARFESDYRGVFTLL